MKSISTIRLAAVLAPVLVVAVCNSTSAQDTSSDSIPTWKEHCVAEASKYAIQPVAQQDAGQKWNRIETAVFSHANPIARDEHGLVYMWTAANSKPVAVVTVIVSRRGEKPWYDVHELHSLHDYPIEATYDGNQTWNPDRGGLRWNIVPDAPEPASDERLMQRQAKILARKFTSQARMNGEDWKPAPNRKTDLSIQLQQASRRPSRSSLQRRDLCLLPRDRSRIDVSCRSPQG